MYEYLNTVWLGLIAMCLMIQTCSIHQIQKVEIINAYEMKTNSVRITNPSDVGSNCNCH